MLCAAGLNAIAATLSIVKLPVPVAAVALLPKVAEPLKVTEGVLEQKVGAMANVGLGYQH